MPSDSEYEVLRERYLRLRRAAERVLEAASYPISEGAEQRVYASQLRDLERELRGEPQPHGFTWMSVS
jgi:hypothetical protein